MPKLLILYYSSFGHVEMMAHTIAEGVISAGAEADVRRVAETVPAEVAKAMHFKLEQTAPLADPADLAGYDGIIMGAPTRFGRMPTQMTAFWDQTGPLWMQGALVGKVGAAFTATASQHGGQETTLFSMLTNMMHHGMVLAGLPSTFQGQMGVDEIRGGSPYGPTTVTAGDGSRLPSPSELDGARFLGAHVARIAAKLAA
ncbi:NAD(P)H:quinone oxidoreductase [Sphingobium phenoxybenzoativorans]|uniref:NAD(P)H:quinone oxidoreductase n=1 Tax=Sphingobium phenoxybenzoativorans TaxID=1592790 RepID=UPI0008723469|nr:NAD(P)H:quinone oxidoreductase [Sphingobium phenoxybenzoativorans]